MITLYLKQSDKENPTKIQFDDKIESVEEAIAAWNWKHDPLHLMPSVKVMTLVAIAPVLALHILNTGLCVASIGLFLFCDTFLNTILENYTELQAGDASSPPKPIESEEELESALKISEALHFKKNRSLEETAEYLSLVNAIADYEEKYYPMEPSTPHEILQHLMESSGATQDELIAILGTKEIFSAILSGERPISQPEAKTLGEYFKLCPSLFFPTPN